MADLNVTVENKCLVSPDRTDDNFSLRSDSRIFSAWPKAGKLLLV
jgi:hypothetical protein